jgi:hypothetical protein
MMVFSFHILYPLLGDKYTMQIPTNFLLQISKKYLKTLYCNPEKEKIILPAGFSAPFMEWIITRIMNYCFMYCNIL